MQKIFGILFLACAAVFVFSGNVSSVMAQETQAVSSVDAGNKICPVMGNAASAKVTAEYKGKIYHFCCPMCIQTFNQDPEKYSKIADDEVAARQAK